MKYKSFKNIKNKKSIKNTKKQRRQIKGGNSENTLMLCHDFLKHKRYFFANNLGDNFYAEDIFNVVDYIDPKATSAILPKGEQFTHLEDIPDTRKYDKIFSLFCPLYDCFSGATVKDVYESKISFHEVLQTCRLDVFKNIISNAVKLLSKNGVLFIPITRKVGPKNRLHVTDIEPQLFWEYIRDMLDIIGLDNVSMGYIRTERLKNDIFVFTGVFHRPTISFEDVPYHILIANNDDAIHSIIQ